MIQLGVEIQTLLAIQMIKNGAATYVHNHPPEGRTTFFVFTEGLSVFFVGIFPNLLWQKPWQSPE